MAKLNNNALKHGISAKTLILQNEDPAQFQEILQSYLDEWQPVSPTQMHFVAEMAEARWNLRRISRYQTAMLDMEMDAQAPEFEKRYITHDEDIRGCSAFCSLADKGKGLNTVHRFHVHYGRVFRHSLNELQNKNPEPERDNPPECQPEKDPPAPPPPPPPADPVRPQPPPGSHCFPFQPGHAPKPASPRRRSYFPSIKLNSPALVSRTANPCPSAYRTNAPKSSGSLCKSVPDRRRYRPVDPRRSRSPSNSSATSAVRFDSG